MRRRTAEEDGKGVHDDENEEFAVATKLVFGLCHGLSGGRDDPPSFLPPSSFLSFFFFRFPHFSTHFYKHKIQRGGEGN